MRRDQPRVARQVGSAGLPEESWFSTLDGGAEVAPLGVAD